jgi:predicted NBD/HSP70 family sugar kinase
MATGEAVHLGVDIGGTRIRCGAVTADGTILKPARRG